MSPYFRNFPKISNWSSTGSACSSDSSERRNPLLLCPAVISDWRQRHARISRRVLDSEPKQYFQKPLSTSRSRFNVK
jgi:hypothetical protein